MASPKVDLVMPPEAFTAWLATLPMAVKETALAYPPDCYRERARPQTHYALLSYDEDKKTGAVSLTLGHGSDSTLPGVQVFGATPNTVDRCGCGKWRHANHAQRLAMDKHFAELDRARSLATKDDDEL